MGIIRNPGEYKNTPWSWSDFRSIKRITVGARNAVFVQRQWFILFFRYFRYTRRYYMRSYDNMRSKHDFMSINSGASL